MIFSIGLFVFSIYCYFLVGAESPGSTPTELGAAFWPRIILVLMMILLGINIFTQFKNKSKEDESKDKSEVKSKVDSAILIKLLIGMGIVALMAFSMQYVGFLLSCFAFLIAYGALLGEKNIAKLVLFSLIITFVLYVIFQGLLDIRLERGRGIFRSLALYLEGIILYIRRGGR